MTLIKAFSLALLGALVAGQEHTASATIRPDVSGSAPAISGTVDFTQEDAESPIQISIRVSGFAPSSVHGVHIHSLPVPANQNCSATGGHFNPLNATHGAQENDSRTRHVGDLGNVTCCRRYGTCIHDNQRSFNFHLCWKSKCHWTCIRLSSESR